MATDEPRPDDATRGQVTPGAAELYERFFVPALFGQWPRRLLELTGVDAGDAVLDIACGTGVVARAAKPVVGTTGTVTGIDLNEGMLMVAARTAPNISWVRGPAESLPMPDDSFDKVFCQFGLMFFDDRMAAVGEMARVLRAGGTACVATWAGLPETPGYAAMIELLDDLFGPEVAAALGAPFTIGTSAELHDVMATAFGQVTVRRLGGSARFPSIDDWVTTDVRAWTLRNIIDDAQAEELRAAAQVRLREFSDSTGRVSFDAPAFIAVART